MMTVPASTPVLVVGCFTTDPTSPALNPGLATFHLDGDDLHPIATASLSSPAWLVAADESVIALCHTPDSAVVRVDPTTLSVGASTPTGGADGCHAALSPDGAWLAVAHYTSGTIAIVPWDSGATPAETTVTTLRFAGGSASVPELATERHNAAHAHQVVWLDDHHLLVCDLGSDLVRIVGWRDGHASELGSIATTPGFGPRHLVLRSGSATPAEIAVAGELSGEVASFRHLGHDWTSGWQRVSQVAGSLIGGNTPSALRSVDDQRLVLANRGINTVATLDWHESGQLVVVDEFDSGGDHPRDLLVHDNHLWVAHLFSHDVCGFTTTPTGWRLTSRTEITNPAALLIWPGVPATEAHGAAMRSVRPDH